MARTSDPWMTEEVVEGYIELAHLGLVYSAEAWDAKGALVAGHFGIFSNGHIQGISHYRDLKHPLADGIGNFLSESEIFYYWRRGIRLYDAEVAKIKGTDKVKQGVAAMPAEEFWRHLVAQNNETIQLFEGATIGQPFPVVENDFIEKFRAMKASHNYHF